MPGRLLPIALVFGFLAQPAAGAPGAVDALLDQFLAADAAGRLKLVEPIVATRADPLAVETRLRAGRRYMRGVPTGWQILENLCTDGQRRPYHVFVPESYDPAKKYPLRFALHGGVGRPDLLPAAIVTESRRRLAEVGRADGMIVILPLGQRGATWLDEVGHANLLAQLEAVKRLYNVDEDRVCMGGFSDGGSGAYWTALHRPTPWAGFASLSGSLLVAGGGAYQAYPRNLTHRPLHAVNGGIDRLYPAAIERRFIDQVRRLGAALEWTEYPDADHDLSYRDTEDPHLRSFLTRIRRPAHRPDIVWEAAEPANGRCDWVRIDEIRDVGNNSGPETSNLLFDLPPPFVLAGDANFPGPGVRIRSVPRGSLGEGAGLRPGDIITRIEGVDILTGRDGQKVYFSKLLAKRPGDTISGTYVRDEQERTFHVVSRKVPPEPMYTRDRPSGLLEAHAHGNRIEVRARHVARYTLLIDRRQFDLAQPIEITTNGTDSYRGRVTPDLAFLLRQAAADNDRSTVYCARVEVTVAPRAGKSGKSSTPVPARPAGKTGPGA